MYPTLTTSGIFRALTALASLALLGCADTSGPARIDPEATRPHFTVLLGTETRITNDPAIQEWPAISGDQIVWLDDGDGVFNPQLYLYDASIGTETQITTDPARPRFRPHISGIRVVWMDFRAGNYDIYMYDFSTGTESQITNDLAHQGDPAISGDRIVWADDRNGNLDIYMYDIATSTETQITSNSAIQSSPAISGDRIVWSDRRNGDADIYMYDLGTGTETQITTDPAGQTTPAISGERIVWMDSRHHSSCFCWSIYMYDLSSGVETPIYTDAAGTRQYPEISGLRVVWQEFGFDDTDIYMYDLSTSTVFRVTDDAESQGAPTIAGNRVTWSESGNGTLDIFMFEIATGSFECIAAVRDKLNEYEAGGQVTNAGVVESLRALLDQAEAAAARGGATAARNILEAFIHHVQAQSGRNIDPSAATTLEDMARAAIGCL